MINAIARLCQAAHRLSQQGGWTLTGAPVVTYEFADASSYYAAREQLWASLRGEARFNYKPQEPKQVAPNTEEIQCMGITFRITLLDRHPREYF